jgi:hypothetical protein
MTTIEKWLYLINQKDQNIGCSIVLAVLKNKASMIFDVPALWLDGNWSQKAPNLR